MNTSNTSLICPVCGQALVVTAAASGGTTHCPRCSAYIAIPDYSGGAIRIDTQRTSRTAAAQGKDWLGGMILVTLLLLTLALLPVVYFVVGNALRH